MSCEDQAITPMPKSCPLWPCCKTPDKAILENINGFMVCPICKGSYGEPASQSQKNRMVKKIKITRIQTITYVPDYEWYPEDIRGDFDKMAKLDMNTNCLNLFSPFNDGDIMTDETNYEILED